MFKYFSYCFILCFLAFHSAKGALNNLQFEWNASEEAFFHQGERFPTLVFYEHYYYRLESLGGELTISDSNSSLYGGSDLFKNMVEGDGEYIFFSPDENTPRLLQYQNLAFPSDHGQIVIKPFEQRGLVKMDPPGDSDRFGSNLAVTNDLTIFASAPGFNNNQGLIVKFIQKEDGNYSFDLNLSSPDAASNFFGASIFYEQNSSKLLFGAPNANFFKGSLYNSSTVDSSVLLVADGFSAGDMFGWSSVSASGKIFTGALSALDSQGGYVSVLNSATVPPSPIFSKLRPVTAQFGNEFGYSLSADGNYLLVGAPGEDDLIRENTGAAYLFKFDGDSYQSSKILSDNRNDDDRFGQTVWLSDDLIYVGAPYGDGSTSQSGLVYVFSYNSENLTANEVFRIESPVAESGIKFGQNMVVHGDFIFISAPWSGESGAVYIFKRLADSLSWKHVHSINLDQFSANLSLPENINLAVNQGILAIGLEGESSISADSGALKVLHNPAWSLSDIPRLSPFFENNDIVEVTATEDQSAPVVIDFNASLPELNSFPIYWDIQAINPSISEENFEINNTTGEFIFNLPQDLFGDINFEVSASQGTEKHSHFFDVQIQPIQDLPIFLDFNLSEIETGLLPKATVNETFNYSFNLFDADGETVSISLSTGQLPNGLTIEGLSIQGVPILEGNYTFSISLSDGQSQVNRSFKIEVFPSNVSPSVLFLGENLVSPASVDLQFSENFPLSEWQQILSTMTITDEDSEQILIEIVDQPSHGYLFVSEQFEVFDNSMIRYTPKFNFHGTDSFSLRFADKHLASPKYFELTFNLFIESENSSPFVTSQDPPTTVSEGDYFEHVFEIFDAEEDYYSVLFKNLPEWINFDGVRRIFGKPTRDDFVDSASPFFISVTDQWGSTYTEKFQIGIIPSNYPPVISYLDKNVSEIILTLEEDGLPVVFDFTALDPDTENNSLIWEISMQPLHGVGSIVEQESTSAKFTYSPDGNFSGSDHLEITVYEDQDFYASDKIKVVFDVEPKPDLPKFESKPFPGIAYNRPWIYEIRGIDGDQNDQLTLTSLVDLPSWLRLSQTDDRSWTFRGQPNSLDEEIAISIRLSDQNSSVDQNFTLKVLESIEDLNFTHNNEINLVLSPEYPNKKFSEIYLDEDTMWSIDLLAVNAIDEIRVKWEILQSPENGIFSFEPAENGTITDLKYIPNQHFFGLDKIVLEASDNYSTVQAEISFNVQSVEDPLVFDEFPAGLIESEDEQFDFFLSYQDGDGLVTLNDIEFLGLPDWLRVEDYSSSIIGKTLRLSGEPKVQDIGLYQITAKISDLAGNQTTADFDLKVNFFNKPPVPEPDAISSTFMEDSYNEVFPKKWLNYFSALDEETLSEDLIWSIVSPPLHGSARINESGTDASYYPDANFSGNDFFTIGVMDRGFNDFLPRQALIPVTINVLQENDLPIFQSSPPSDSNNSFLTTWNDEDSYTYEVSVLDSDWPWQGYPTLSLLSSLPSWANWKDLGQGKGILSGSPQWFHQGKYSFSILARSGNDEVVQNFDLEIVVDDYPPRVLNSNNEVIYKKIQIFILEDGSLDDVKKMVEGLRAFNPDKIAGETLRWLPYINPSSGGQITLTSYLDEDKIYARVSAFDYQVPANFNGIDRFTLLVDEGDRQTEIVFEINIKALPDPPEFPDVGPISSNVLRGNYFEKVITAIDPDYQPIDFKVLYPNKDSKWLSIKSEVNDASNPSVTIGGIVPQDFEADSYTLLASDPTGRFALLVINLSADL